MNLESRCNKIQELFEALEIMSGKLSKEAIIKKWRDNNIELAEDLDFCFEVLAGKHKLGYTFIYNDERTYGESKLDLMTIKEFVNTIKQYPATDEMIYRAGLDTPFTARPFIAKLVNREYRLGYSNKNNMITNLSPMLAKKYQDVYREQYYYVQEKLDGNRCIAYYDFEDDQWKFQSRSGKPLKVSFDMSWANTDDIFDGEIMTLGKAGSRDFNRTSGAINGKYTDKSQLHYFIYDIVDESLTYENRKVLLDTYSKSHMTNTQILPVLDKVWVWPNHDYNESLDKWLDFITDKGGEGVILRDPDAKYQCGKRSDALLKYKKLQTMDLRIVGWNEGNGKYEGAIGSFICQTDDESIKVNVSGMPDSMHFSDPEDWFGKIIEVAYFDISKSANNNYSSLRFPRLKRIRDDKDTTSIY